jgi:hypothetical protein
VQSAESILGPIQQGDVTTSDASEQEQQQGEKKSGKKGDDDSGVDPSLGLINSGPVQLKSDLEQPVTSGGMETMIEGPGTSD